MSEELYALVVDQSTRLKITPTDVLRDAVTQYFFNQSQGNGFDAGFRVAQNHLPYIARAAMLHGIRDMPLDDFDAAIRWVKQILGDGPRG